MCYAVCASIGPTYLTFAFFKRDESLFANARASWQWARGVGVGISVTSEKTLNKNSMVPFSSHW